MTPGSAGTFADLLAVRHRFVGRTHEREVFGRLLAAVDPVRRILFLHGPGGIGKTSMLAAWSDQCRQSGRPVIHVDGHVVAPSADAVLAAIGVRSEQSVATALPPGSVVMIDTYERLEPVDPWLRSVLVPALPADCLLVIAGRSRPAGWRADSALHRLTDVVALRNLTPDEGAELLSDTVTDADVRAELVRRSHGHPLGLAVLADTVGQGGALPPDGWPPTALDVLLPRFLDSVPTPHHRRAVDALAIVRVMSETTLRTVIDGVPAETVGEIFDWLRHLSFVESGPDGLFPHELARDVIAGDLRWRDPAAFGELVAAIRDDASARWTSTTGRALQSAIVDSQFLMRGVALLAERWDVGSLGQAWYDVATAADRDDIVGLVDRWEGPESAAQMARWWELQPEGFIVVRDQFEDFAGVLVVIDLSRAAAGDIAADPLAAAAWRHVVHTRRPRPGEAVLLFRNAVDRDRHTEVSRVSNLAPTLAMQRSLQTPALGWSVFAVQHANDWDAYNAYLGVPRVPGLEVRVAGHATGFFAHDFAAVPMTRWLEQIGAQLTTAMLDGSVAAVPEALALSHVEFVAAVKRALRDLHEPAALSTNPLCASRVVRDAADGLPPADALAAVLRDAVAALAARPREEKSYRALDRTYLRPAASQEGAAQVLGIPFSTYRRHLTAGVAAVAAALWHADLNGAPPTSGSHSRP